MHPVRIQLLHHRPAVLQSCFNELFACHHLLRSVVVFHQKVQRKALCASFLGLFAQRLVLCVDQDVCDLGQVVEELDHYPFEFSLVQLARAILVKVIKLIEHCRVEGWGTLLSELLKDVLHSDHRNRRWLRLTAPL